MPLRRGFTMIELLVVVSVIAVLAGILIPTVGLVRHLANDVKCGNNLQQIGACIIIWKHDHDDAFPGRAMRDLTSPQGPIPGLKKIFLCPFDRATPTGTSSLMGRHPTWPNYSSLWETGSSYDYEVCEAPLPQQSDVDFFFNDLPRADTTSPFPLSKPVLGSADATWMAGKLHEKYFGNFKDITNTVRGSPFPGPVFPIMRCYWHYKWTGKDSDKSALKMKNLSWDLNVFNSTPYWEHDFNPAFN